MPRLGIAGRRAKKGCEIALTIERRADANEAVVPAGKVRANARPCPILGTIGEARAPD